MNQKTVLEQEIQDHASGISWFRNKVGCCVNGCLNKIDPRAVICYKCRQAYFDGLIVCEYTYRYSSEGTNIKALKQCYTSDGHHSVTITARRIRE